MNKSKGRIITCLDLRDGKVVKGVKFEDVRKVGNPINLAAEYAAQGSDEVVLYDITASIDGRGFDVGLVQKVRAVIGKDYPLTVGGGIASIGDAKTVIDAGADKVSVNSAAVKTPELIKELADEFGSSHIVVGIDAKRDGKGGYSVMRGGGKIDTGMQLIEWVKKVQDLGAGEICLNSIDADGTRDGYDLEMLNAVCEVVSIPIVASGGCGKVEHFSEVFEKSDASAALAASMFHFGGLMVSEVKEHLKEKGIS